ncbi:MAG: AMP-binding protein [Steroidobacteraceae bacterium]
MNHGNLRATAIVARNSLSYVELVLELNATHQPLVAVASEAAARDLGGITVERVVVPEERSGWYERHHPLIHLDEPAQVAYTSGTEGKPKGIVLTYANLADAAERIIAVMGLDAGVREYVGVPATYSFGMGRFRAISAVGGRAYLPPRGFDPLELARMLAAGEVNSLAAVPTLLRILLASPEVIGNAGAKLRWMEIGSQYMSAQEKLAIRAMFPNARIVQHYGLTEASRTTFLEISDVPAERLESVGRATGGTHVRITDDGRVQIRGPHVARWRIDSEGLHALQDAEGWLLTNDLGHFEDGYLHYDGRADDLINIGGIKVLPDLLEGRIRGLIGQGTKLAVARVPDPLRGDGVLVVAEPGDADSSRIRTAASTALREFGVEAGNALHVNMVEAIPRTATGKAQRRLITEQFRAEQPLAAPAQPDAADDHSVLAFFQRSFPDHTVTPEDSFETLGGDSLQYIRFSMDFERRFGTPPSHWEGMSVAQLQAGMAGRKKSFWRRLESSIFTRAMFMTFIVALHVDAFIYSRNWGAAYFLVLLAGYSVVRFQLPEINRSGRVSTILGTVLRVAIPTILVVALLQLAARTFELKPLLLISNFFDPSQYKIVTYYFVEFYIQLLLLAALLFSFPAVRTQFNRQPMLSALVLLAVVEIINFVMGRFWNTTYIFDRTPQNYAWAFVCGMVIASARSFPARTIAMLTVVAATWIKWGPSSAMYWVDGGTALLLFVPEFYVPAPIKILAGEIAGASMFIFLSHWHVHTVVTRLFGHEMPWVSLVAALAVGIVFARCYLWMENRVRALLARRNARIPADQTA